MNLNIAVVDDTRLDGEKLQRNIHKWFTENTSHSQTVTCFRDGESLLRDFKPAKFQMVFMDIMMNSLNGIQTAQKLRASDNKALIIFTTASRDFAFEAFPIHPFDYIIKPCTPERLGRVLTEAVNFLEPPEPVVDVHVSRSTYTLRLRDISTVKSMDHFVDVVLSDGRSILCSMSFTEIQAKLTDPRFLLCNRGLIVNMDCAASLSRNRDAFLMNDDSTLPIHIRGRAKVINDFTQYQISRIRRIQR